MNTLISYKNDPKLKKIFVDEIENHRKQDAIMQGTYGRFEDGLWKGCAVGCSIHSLNVKLGEKYETDNHSVYETALGIPEWLARLEDTIFEGLPISDAKKWPGQFAKAVPVGVNLEPVKWKFCSYLMKENIDRVMNLNGISENLKKEVVDAIRNVLNIHTTAIETGIWNESAAESASWSAESASWSAESASRSAAWSASWSAESAAESASWSAESASRSAESASRSAAWSASWSAAYKKHAKYLLILLKKAK